MKKIIYHFKEHFHFLLKKNKVRFIFPKMMYQKFII